MSYPSGSGGGEYVDPITGQTRSYGQSPQPYDQPSQAYGQPPGQGQSPGYGGAFYQGTTYTGGLYGGGKPPKNTKKPLIIAAIAVVVLLGIGAVVISFVDTSDDEQAAPPATAAPSSQSPPPSTGSPATTGDDSAVIPASTPGWQGVYVPKEKIAYDVPKKGWKVATVGTIAGWEDAKGKPTATFHGVSNYLSNWCPSDPGASRALVGVQHTDINSAKAARAAVIYYGSAIEEKPSKPANVDESKGAPVKINGGKTTATLSSAIVPIKYDKSTPKKCRDAKNSRVTAVAFDPKTTKDPKTGKSNIAIVTIVSDLGGKQELPKSVIDKIVASIRPAPTRPR